MPKQFLPLGPWDPVEELGDGPSNVWRILKLFDQLRSEFAEIQFTLILVLPKNDAAAYEIGFELQRTFSCLLASDPEPGWGPLGFLHTIDWSAGLIMHNADDIVGYSTLATLVRFAAGGEYYKEHRNALVVADTAQYGQYGTITNGPYNCGPMIYERPLLAEGPVGCGVVYLTARSIQEALKDPEIRNSSVLLNTMTSKHQTPLVTFKVAKGAWQTFNTPKEYKELCESMHPDDPLRLECLRSLDACE
jgi:hypothetical protein